MQIKGQAKVESRQMIQKKLQMTRKTGSSSYACGKYMQMVDFFRKTL